MSYSDIKFYHEKSLPHDVLDNYPIFRPYLRDKIIIRLVDFISFTGNKTAIDPLFDLIFDGVSLDLLKKINWEELVVLDDKFNIINLICKNDTDKTIEAITNEEELLFLLNLLNAVDAGYSTLPLYIHLLKYFKEKNKYYAGHLEMEIDSFIASRSIDFPKYEELEGLE